MAGRDKSWELPPSFRGKRCQWGVFRKSINVYNRANSALYKAVPHEVGRLYYTLQGAKTHKRFYSFPCYVNEF